MTIFVDHRDDQTDLWVGQREGDPEFVFEGFLKVVGGVKHVVNRFDNNPTMEEMLSLLESRGLVSPRPYQPGQFCDGSITSCVMALFYDFCKRYGLNAAGVHATAYPDRAEPNWEEQYLTMSFADWQGVAYPRIWTLEHFVRLLDSLNAVNRHSLSNELEEAVASLGVYSNVTMVLTSKSCFGITAPL